MTPLTNGLEVIEQLRHDSKLACVPISAMSAAPEMLHQARQLGANGVMAKRSI